MVFQNYALWPHMTVYDNVAFGLVERRESRDTIRRKVGEVLELVGLSQYAQRRPGQLSGGQQQRVALARTVVIAPKLLLLDEPLSNLDKQLRVQMREELRSLQRKLGLTTIFVTHDQEEAMTTADRMAVLDKGVLQQVGSAAGLYDYPANRFVAGFVGTANVLEGEVLPTIGESLVFKVPGLGTLTLPRPAQPPVPGAQRWPSGRTRCRLRCATMRAMPRASGWKGRSRAPNSWASSRATACAWARWRWSPTRRTTRALPCSPWACRCAWASSPRSCATSMSE